MAATARRNGSLTDRSLLHRRWTIEIASAPSRRRSRSIPSAQPLGCVRGHQATAVIVLPAELGRDHEVVRVGAGRLREQLAADVWSVVPGRIEYPHSELE